MSGNSKSEAIWTANVAVPGGGNTIYFESREEAKTYDADPDAFAAKHFGLTKIEYLQWVDTDGAALCSHRTKGGDLCRNLISRIQLSAKQWKARHRKALCTTHARPKPK